MCDDIIDVFKKDSDFKLTVKSEINLTENDMFG